jgi:hypothetical protein
MIATKHATGKLAINRKKAMASGFFSDPGASKIMTENPAGITPRIPRTPQATLLITTIDLATIGFVAAVLLDRRLSVAAAATKTPTVMQNTSVASENCSFIGAL